MSQYSLSQQYYETLKQIQKNVEAFDDMPLEEARRSFKNLIPTTISDYCIVDEVKLDEKYVIKSKECLVDKLKVYEDVIDEKWQCLDNNGLYGEWIKVKDMKDTRRVVLYLFGGGYCMGSPEMSRSLTCKIAETAECPVFVINYRLSPEHQFPAQLCDALAAYLYLTNPGPEAGFEPFNPKQIIFSGSSAGGGLAVATALFLRDADLPLPSGLVLWSAWLDLTNSMPSIWDPEMDKTDYLPGDLGISKFKSVVTMSNEIHEQAKLLAEKIKQKKPKVVSHPSFTKVPRFRLHCANEALAIPYVSPMLAESLGNLPPILCQVGGGERLLDSSILFSFRASDPNKFQVPKYVTMNFANSRFKKPTEVILEVYDELFHCFQRMIPDKISEFSIKRSCDFIKNQTLNKNISDEADRKSLQGINKTITAIAISPNCEIRELDERYLECLNWENIGVVPEVED
ncbi:Alpha/Beta hydrolase protein [Gigaspora rosea]|uniref:Alpha/Beta hydrolase protein n=1 Tax=Gigaspora rosea TaxID=44941 RepID=A0A397VW84_9GLOM|nr:Alpha/Beta hydrolase protein [Gigaspora rosea]